jgi:hypothetical protein
MDIDTETSSISGGKVFGVIIIHLLVVAAAFALYLSIWGE